jgi:pimeloyl-ACP methyl ester carboxylesterase
MRRIALAVTLAIAVLVTGGLAFRDSREPTMNIEAENRTTASRDGTAIAYTKRGSGPPLIIVDGVFCYRENGPATELALLLAERYTVFTYDRRGRGASGDTPPYAVDREVEDIRALEGEAGAPPFLLGISSGAALTLQAVAAGVAARKVALYEPPYAADADRPRPLGDAANRVQSLIASGDRAGAVKFFMTDVFGAPRPFVLAMPFLMPGAWKRNKQVVHTAPYDLRILADTSVLNARASSISVSTLVVGGEKSPKGLRDAVTAVASALPKGTSRFLPGQTHMISAPVLVPVLVEYFGAS